MPANLSNLTKKYLFSNLLEKGKVYLYLNQEKEGVVIPKYLMNSPVVCLEFSHDCAIPIDFKEITNTHIRAVLSFNRMPFECVIPWDSVYLISPGDSRPPAPKTKNSIPKREVYLRLISNNKVLIDEDSTYVKPVLKVVK